jgi:hypothetical protein
LHQSSRGTLQGLLSRARIVRDDNLSNFVGTKKIKAYFLPRQFAELVYTDATGPGAFLLQEKKAAVDAPEDFTPIPKFL